MTEASEPDGRGPWQVDSLRLTVFVEELTKTADVLWRSLIEGDAPETSTVSRRGASQAEGPFNAGHLTVTIQTGRVDLALSAQANASQPQVNLFQAAMATPGGAETLTFLGPLGGVVASFSPLAEGLLRGVGAARFIRLGYGAVLSIAANDKVDGYRKLVPYVQNYLKLDPEGCSDLSYTINRRRLSQSGPKDLWLNRLSKWNVLIRYLSLVEVSVQQPRFIPPTQIYVGPHVEIDTNTAPEFIDGLSLDQALLVGKELQSLAVEIAEKGDTP